MLTQLTENNLAELTKDKVVLLDFSATWCAPCHMLGQELEELDNEKFDIIKIDIDDYEKLAKQYGILVVPTMRVMVDGKEVTMQVKVGDQVIYSKYAGNEVKLDDEEYIIVKQSDILAIVE